MWIDNLCRLCAQVSEVVFPVFEKEGERPRLDVKIRKCLSLMISDDDCKPKHICYNCTNKLEDFYEFLELCQSTDYKFDSILYAASSESSRTVKSNQVSEQLTNESTMSVSHDGVIVVGKMDESQHMNRDCQDILLMVELKCKDVDLESSSGENNSQNEVLTQEKLLQNGVLRHSDEFRRETERGFEEEFNGSLSGNSGTKLLNSDVKLSISGEKVTKCSKDSVVAVLKPFQCSYNVSNREFGEQNGGDLDPSLGQTMDLIKPFTGAITDESGTKLQNGTVKVVKNTKESVLAVLKPFQCSYSDRNFVEQTGGLDDAPFEQSFASAMQENAVKVLNTASKVVKSATKDSVLAVLKPFPCHYSDREILEQNGAELETSLGTVDLIKPFGSVHDENGLKMQNNAAKVLKNAKDSVLAVLKPFSGYSERIILEQNGGDLEASLGQTMDVVKPFAGTGHDENGAKVLNCASKAVKNNKESVLAVLKPFPCSYADRSFIEQNGDFDTSLGQTVDLIKPFPGVAHDQNGSKVSNGAAKVVKSTKESVLAVLKPFQCNYDNPAAPNLTSANCNVSKVKNGVLKPFPCPHCAKSFMRRSNLNAHMSVHTQIRPFQCQQCDRSFALRWNLTVHQRLHSGLFACEFCGKAFPVKGKLERHRRVHTGEKPFVCSVGKCEKSFADKRNLEAHQRTHSEDRPFVCGICARAFRSRSHLSDHRRVHSSETPFTCEACGKSFKWKTNLTIHMKGHTGERCVCADCGKQFVRTTQLIKHRRVHHSSQNTSNIVHNNNNNNHNKKVVH